MKLVLEGKCDYKLKESNKPIISEGDNLVRVKACGLCGSDIPRIYQGIVYHYPLVFGHEFSGIIEDSYDKNKIGKKVCIFPIKPCFQCENCKDENYANCKEYDYYGSRCDGGMQDYILTKDFNILILPDNISYEAAAMIEPMSVCLHGIKKADLKKDDVLKVYGAGTIGLLCCMWAKALGVKKIYVFDPDQKKLDFAKKLGFLTDDYIDSDVVIEASGSYRALNSAILDVKAFGKIILIGNASGDMNITVDNYSKVLRKQITLFGSWNSDYKEEVNDWKNSISALERGMINPEKLITHRVKLVDAVEMLDKIKDKKEFYNKVMFVL